MYPTMWKGIPWPLWCHPVEITAQGPGPNADTMAIAIAMYEEYIVLCL